MIKKIITAALILSSLHLYSQEIKLYKGEMGNFDNDLMRAHLTSPTGEYHYYLDENEKLHFHGGIKLRQEYVANHGAFTFKSIRQVFGQFDKGKMSGEWIYEEITLQPGVTYSKFNWEKGQMDLYTNGGAKDIDNIKKVTVNYKNGQPQGEMLYIETDYNNKPAGEIIKKASCAIVGGYYVGSLSFFSRKDGENISREGRFDDKGFFNGEWIELDGDEKIIRNYSHGLLLSYYKYSRNTGARLYEYKNEKIDEMSKTVIPIGLKVDTMEINRWDGIMPVIEDSAGNRLKISYTQERGDLMQDLDLRVAGKYGEDIGFLSSTYCRNECRIFLVNKKIYSNDERKFMSSGFCSLLTDDKKRKFENNTELLNKHKNLKISVNSYMLKFYNTLSQDNFCNLQLPNCSNDINFTRTFLEYEKSLKNSVAKMGNYYVCLNLSESLNRLKVNYDKIYGSKDVKEIYLSCADDLPDTTSDASIFVKSINKIDSFIRNNSPLLNNIKNAYSYRLNPNNNYPKTQKYLAISKEDEGTQSKSRGYAGPMDDVSAKLCSVYFKDSFAGAAKWYNGEYKNGYNFILRYRTSLFADSILNVLGKYNRFTVGLENLKNLNWSLDKLILNLNLLDTLYNELGIDNYKNLKGKFDYLFYVPAGINYTKFQENTSINLVHKQICNKVIYPLIRSGLKTKSPDIIDQNNHDKVFILVNCYQFLDKIAGKENNYYYVLDHLDELTKEKFRDFDVYFECAYELPLHKKSLKRLKEVIDSSQLNKKYSNLYKAFNRVIDFKKDQFESEISTLIKTGKIQKMELEMYNKFIVNCNTPNSNDLNIKVKELKNPQEIISLLKL